MIYLLKLLLITSVALLSIGCSTQSADPNQTSPEAQKKAAEAKDPAQDLVVATVGKTKITVGDLSNEINRQNPYLRMRISSDDRKKDFLKKMIRFEVLAAEARRKNFDEDPEVIRRAKRAMIDQLMADLSQNLVKMADITDQEIEAFYKANHEKYHKPPMVRVSQVVLGSLAEAKRVRALAKKKPTDARYFVELVRQHSLDEASKARGGDLGFLSSKSVSAPSKSAPPPSKNAPAPKKSVPTPPEVVAAAFKIVGMWQLSEPFQVGERYVVLMKTGARDAVNRPLEAVRARIKNRLFNEKRITATENFIQALQTKAQVVIKEENLSKVKIDLKPPSAAPGARRLGIQPPGPRPPGKRVGASRAVRKKHAH